MAYSVSVSKKTVFGDQRVQHLVVTADAATGSYDTGLDYIDGGFFVPKSAASTTINMKLNEGVASTSIAGTIAITGATSGDDFYVTVFGR